MSWRTEWSALSARIRGLTAAAEYYWQARVKAGDAYSAARYSLAPQASGLYDAVRTFSGSYANVLPQGASECLTRFLQTRSDVFTNSSVLENEAILFTVTALAAFQSEFDYHVADLAAYVKRQSERAFLHLQRSITVDLDERRKWKAAFKDGETACEQLGAVRLLSHGIWAFKVDAVGERTDLVLQEPLVSTDEIERAADGLVLTEWKLCSGQADLVAKIREAKAQVQRYRAGALAALELVAHRYLVIVSTQHLAIPGDEVEGGIRYRHINIAVSPNTPSRDSRRTRKQQPV